MASWKITALDTGSSLIDKSVITYLTDPGTKIRIPRVMWYLEGPRKIIVDTSVGDPAQGERVLGEPTARTPEQHPDAALKRAGIDPTAIDYVILSHLHWDHCGNNHLFPRAKFLVQYDELRYAIAPAPPFGKGYLAPTIGETPPYWGTRFDPIDGEIELEPGLRIIRCSGHSPGLQSVLVQTTDGIYCIASDAIMSYENAEKLIPPGFHWRIEESVESMQRILRSCDHYLPAHDYALFKEGTIARFP